MPATMTRLTVFAALAMLGSSPVHAGPYRVIDIGTLGGSTSAARGINAHGEVVGFAPDANGINHAFYFVEGSAILPLDANGGPAQAFAINNSGEIAGWFVNDDGETAAAKWSDFNGSPVALGGLGGTLSLAYDLNNAGVATGYAQNEDFMSRAFTAPPMTDIGTLCTDNKGYCQSSAGIGINDSNWVVGNSIGRAFVWRGGGDPVDIGTLSGVGSAGATDINNVGQVVGSSSSTNGNRAFIWSDADGMLDLGLPDGYVGPSTATAVNAHGVAVGWSTRFSGDDHATIFVRGAALPLDLMRDAQSLSWILREAHDINDAGQIVGMGYFSGQDRAFLMNPGLAIGWVEPLLRGQDNTLIVLGAQPNATIHIIYSLGSGSREVPACPGLFVGMSRPQIAGTVVTDAGGTAEFTGFVPDAVGEELVTVQFVDQANCEVSNFVKLRFD